VLIHHDPLLLHVYTDSGRFYSIEGQHYPGVGNILSATESPEQQEFWHQYRAVPGNAAYSQQARDRGKLFHAVVEHHFQPKNIRLDSQDSDQFALAQMLYIQPFWQSVQNVLPRISDIELIESACWHEVGHYAGTVDLVCHFDGVPVILDWKTATKPKKTEYLDRYPLQLTAYCACLNRMYGTRIKTGVIVVALPNREAQVFQFTLGNHWQPWLTRLVSYWEQQGTPLAEQALRMIRGKYLTKPI